MVSDATPERKDTGQATLLVACLCAQWCGTCRDYRATFDQLAREFTHLRFVWIDIEDQAELVDPVDVDDFPTLLIASAQAIRFFGPLAPHVNTLRRLLQHQTQEEGSQEAYGPLVSALAQRLRTA
jgi:thiol-disulfide isomerase/thioredoxin